MIEVASPVEIDQWLQSDLSGDVGLRLSGGHLLGSVVEGVDVRVVMVLVVELHDFAGDGGFEGAVVICW